MSPIIKKGKLARVIGYVRVSTDEQANSGAGLESQKGAIEAECDRRGWELRELIEDAGFSGKSFKRPGIQKAIEKLTKKEADVLVCSKLDRLSRSVKDFCELVELGQKKDFAIVVLDVNVDTSTPTGEMIANVMATFAQYERRLISQRTKDALRVKIAQGVKVGRSSDTSTETLAYIKELRENGLSIRKIAARLNEEGVPTARGGQKWHPTRIQELLRG